MNPKKKSSLKQPYILLTCEHADYKIPDFVKSKIPVQFSIKNLQKRHDSYDKDAFNFSKLILKYFKSQGIKSDLVSYPYTRLIIDANRTLKNKNFTSKIAPFLKENEIEKIKSIYLNYVDQVENLIEKNRDNKDIYIFSVHSFIPVYKTKKRKTDIGLLFRTKILKEVRLADKLKKEIQRLDPKPNVHKNLPYRGHTDCFLNYILDQHKNSNSVNGLFFEFNQNYLSSSIIKNSEVIGKAIQTCIK